MQILRTEKAFNGTTQSENPIFHSAKYRRDHAGGSRSMQRQLKTIWGTNFAGVCRIWRGREVRVRLAAHPGEGAERFIFECRAHGKCSREIAVEHLCQKSRKTWKVYLCISTPHIYLTCTWKCLFFLFACLFLVLYSWHKNFFSF